MSSTMRWPGAVAAVLAATAAIADTRLTIEESMVVALPGSDAAPQETRTEYTLWMREDRAARVAGGGRMVVRMDRSESYIIDDAARTAVVMALDGPPEGFAAPPRIERTGEIRMIGTWNAERYDLTFELVPGETGSMVLWISGDIGIELEAYRVLSSSLDGGQGFLTAIASLPGYPVLQEVTVGSARGTTRLLAVSEAPAPPGTYDVPADYARAH